MLELGTFILHRCIADCRCMGEVLNSGTRWQGREDRGMGNPLLYIRRDKRGVLYQLLPRERYSMS